MWNLFSAVEPKVIQPAKSLKEQLLLQQEKALTKIQQEVTQMLTSINSVLKGDPNQSPNCCDSQTDLIQQLETIVNCLQTQIATDNNKFEDCITYRDQQKINQQEFFKTTLRAYETKKSELNMYIEELQGKVQTLEMKGFKTYDLNPEPNNVLNGMSQSYLEKYMAKLDEIKQIEQGVQLIAVKNRTKVLKGKQIYSSTDLTPLRETKQNKQNQSGRVGRVEITSKCSSLNELEKELELILLKEEVIGEILDKKIKKCKNTFQKLACQENAFKQSVKKMGVANEEKRRSSGNSNLSSKRLSQLSTPKNHIKKSPSLFNNKAEFNPQISQTLSIDQKRAQQKYHYDKSSSSSHHHHDQQDEQLPRFGGEIQDQEDDEQTASKNFIEACELLITERFIGEDEEHEGDELGLNQREE